MKKIGIVGGIAWQSTVDYYSVLCRFCEQWRAGRDGAPLTPEMSIESLDLDKVFANLGNDDDESSWEIFEAYHREALERLQASGAEVAAMASNSPHHRFANITRGITIPVVNILEVAAAEAARTSARSVLILGTPLAMRSAVFREAFAQQGITATGPDDPAGRSKTMELITDFHRNAASNAEDRLDSIARTTIEQQFSNGAAVSLACTELPLAFPQFSDRASFEHRGIVYINNSAAHIREIFRIASA